MHQKIANAIGSIRARAVHSALQDALTAAGGPVHGVHLATLDGNSVRLGMDAAGSDAGTIVVINPPTLVEDPDGSVVRSYRDPDGNVTHTKTFREDPLEALKQVLANG